MKYIVFFILIVGISLSYGLVQPQRLKVTEITLKDSDIPKSFVGKRIVFLTDIHYGYNFSKKRLSELVTRVCNMRPDLIILGGDYADKEADDYDQAMLIIKDLKAPLGVYGVLGNHDYIKGREYSIDKMESVGFKDLDNQAYWIESGDDKIKIGGVADMWKDEQDIEPTTKDLMDQDFSILVSHNPDYVKKTNSEKIDLVLSGHTHAGQISLFGLWAPWVPSRYGNELRYGLKEVNGFQLYTTSGVGITFLPFRFFTRPEIALITLAR